MTDIEKKALALVNEVSGSGAWTLTSLSHPYNRLVFRSLCRAIEQHEAFRQEVSDAVKAVFAGYHDAPIPWVVIRKLEPFIIAKPDPLADVAEELRETYCESGTQWADALRKALAKRGGKIVWEDD